MPEFASGSQKTAIVPMANPTDKAFDYDAMLYMGVNMVVMSEASFALQAGQEKGINLPVTMPAGPGTYPVYLDVFSGGALLEHYQATEDVIITGGEVIFQGLDYPVYPCYQGRTTAQALLYIPASICPAEATLNIDIEIPRDSDELPLYHPGRPELDYSSDWRLLTTSLVSEDLVSGNNLYVMTGLRELSIDRYIDGRTLTQFLPAGIYPLYMSVSLDGQELSNVYICDLTITSQVLSSFGYSNLQAYDVVEGNRSKIYFSATVTNNGSGTETHVVRIFNRSKSRPWDYTPRATFDLTLAPGQSAVVWDDQLATEGYYFIVIDDQGAQSTTLYHSI